MKITIFFSKRSNNYSTLVTFLWPKARPKIDSSKQRKWPTDKTTMHLRFQARRCARDGPFAKCQFSCNCFHCICIILNYGSNIYIWLYEVENGLKWIGKFGGFSKEGLCPYAMYFEQIVSAEESSNNQLRKKMFSFCAAIFRQFYHFWGVIEIVFSIVVYFFIS